MVQTTTTRYKQTEIGWIPEDWEVKAINEFATIKTGNKNTQDKLESGKYPFFVRSQIIERINSFSFEGEAVLTAGDGVGVGKVFHYINGKFDFHQRVYAIHSFKEGISGFYFYKYFQNNFLNRIMQMTAKSSVDSVRMETISEMQIPLPPLAEQQAIAAALSDCDAWIDSQEKRLAKKRLIKQGAMQQLLGFDSAQPASAVERSRNWEVKKLGEVCDVIGGGTPSTFNSDFWNGKINWFTPTEVGNSKYLFESNRKISTSGLKNSSATILPINTILLTTRAGIGDLGILKIEACTNQGFQSLICKENADYQFIYYLMQTQKNVLLNNASGSTFLEISPNKLKSIEIKMPSLAEQTRIATILSDMDAEITAMENELAKSRQIKQGMMQELLTGRRRLPAASAEVQTGHAPSLHKNQIHKNQIHKNQID